MQLNSIALVILALNEAPTLRASYTTYKNIYLERNLDHEIYIVDDGSTDGTSEIADEIAKEDPLVKVIHHKVPLGMGYGYREAFQLTEKEYFSFTGAYDADGKEQINAVLDCMGKKDCALIYINNPETRPFIRQVYSSLFVVITNFITGLNLKYYNGMQLCRTSLLKSTPTRSRRHTQNAETIVKLIKKRKCSYAEIPILLKAERVKRKSKAPSFRNTIDALRFYLFLIYDLYIADSKDDPAPS